MIKKLLVLALSFGCLLSCASFSWALELNSCMGGRFYSYFTNIKGDRGFNPAPGLDAWDTILGATLREGNTWASIKFIADSWNQKIYHSFGIDNICGTPLSLGFDSHDTGTANVGQQFMGDLFNDFKADPYFNTCDMAGSFFAKYITDAVEIRGEAHLYDSDGDTDNRVDYTTDKNGNTIPAPDGFREAYALTLIFKNDLGKFYVGGKHWEKAKETDPDDALVVAGADFKINDIGVKLDYWSDPAALSDQGEFKKAFWNGKGHQTFQTTVDINNLSGQLMFSQPKDDNLADVFGIGLAYKFDRWTVGTKYFQVDKKVAENGFYDVYGMYKVGAWDIKLGTSNAQFPFGHCGDKTEGGNYYDKQAFENKDGFIYAGMHFEF